jgi:hypothetical protein
MLYLLMLIPTDFRPFSCPQYSNAVPKEFMLYHE